MNKLIGGIVVAALAALAGCNTSPPGGPGASTGTTSKVFAGGDTHRAGPPETHADVGIGVGKDEFRLSGPTLSGGLISLKIKQGQKANVTVSVTRGSDFKQDVKLKVNAPKGLKVTPADPVIKASDKDVQLTVEADKEAPLEDAKIEITGVPEKGKEVPLTINVTVEKS